VVPAPTLGSVPIAIVAPKDEEALVDFANAFVEVGNANGTFAEKLDYWIRGKGAEAERAPRWSVARNLLGWWAR
jgi:hypothetical protein